MRAKLTAFCLFGLVATLVSAGPNVPEAERISGLISQLGSSNYRERLDAFRALDAIGEAALERLKAAAVSADTETSHRATELIRRIEHRVVSARTLTASMVEVKFNEMPVPEAIREFHAKTGLAVSAAGNTSGLKERKVTYQSGRVTVWEALEGFCKAANLSEWNGLTPMPGLPAANVVNEAPGNPVFMPQGRVIFRSSVRSPGTGTAQQVYLYDATPSSLPTHASGAVRVRALPSGTPLPNLTADSDEMIIPLQVTLEPRLSWSGAPSIKIGSATDDRDQRLIASMVNFASAAPMDDDFMVMNAMMAGGIYGTSYYPQRSQYLALRFRKGDRPSKSLKELNGTLSLPLRVNGTIVSVDSPLKAVGKTFRGDHGTMTIHTAEVNDKGEVKVDVSLDLLPDVSPSILSGVNRVAMQNVQIQMQGGGIVQNINGGATNLPNGMVEYMGLAMTDVEGKRFNAAQVFQHQSTLGGMDGNKMRIGLLFRPGKDVGQAARLAFNGSHSASVETEFRFADLPLP